jgi:hypothetical protein
MSATITNAAVITPSAAKRENARRLTIETAIRL